MKPFRAMTIEQAEKLAQKIVGLPLPFSLTIGDGDARTLSQNALLHKWFGEVARHFGDLHALQVKGQCHHKYGLPIRQRNEQFAWVWGKVSSKLDYEQQCKVLSGAVINPDDGKIRKSPPALNISSAMSVIELTEYMDAMKRDYAEQRCFLTDPELRKYEGTRPIYQKTGHPKKAPAYLSALHQLPCCICDAFGEVQNSPTTAHHWIMGRGGSRKTPDEQALPLCDGHHQGMLDTSKIAIHREPKDWEKTYGKDSDYIQVTQDKVAKMFGMI